MHKFTDPLNIIILSQQPWEDKNTGSNVWDMAQVLARDHRVLLVNQALDWSSRVGSGVSKRRQREAFVDQHKGQRVIAVDTNFWVLNPLITLGSFNWLPDSALYDWLNRINGRRMADEIKLVTRQLGWTSFILLNDNDMLRGFYLKEMLQPSLYVYYLRDNLLATPYWQRHGRRLEPLLMRKIDLIVSNSVYLTKQAARYNPDSVYIGQGCDLSLFDPDKAGDEPADLASLPRPRIGYAGALTQIRLDGNLIETVAARRPDWQVVLIGAPDESFPTGRLRALPNVTFLGAKPMQAVPTYLAGMDVLMNPQLLNEVTVGNYPRKIDEYLAMGKPVVAVRTEAMELFEEHVFLAETPDQFLAGIADALAGAARSTPHARSAFALRHTWENSVGLLVEHMDRLLVGRPEAA